MKIFFIFFNLALIKCSNHKEAAAAACQALSSKLWTAAAANSPLLFNTIDAIVKCETNRARFLWKRKMVTFATYPIDGARTMRDVEKYQDGGFDSSNLKQAAKQITVGRYLSSTAAITSVKPIYGLL